jgi:hypothetical protein
VDEDVDGISRDELVTEVRKLRQGISAIGSHTTDEDAEAGLARPDMLAHLSRDSVGRCAAASELFY